MKTDLLSTILKESKADDIVIIKAESDQYNIRFANNSITSSGHGRNASYIVVSIIKGKVGMAAADSITSLDAMRLLLRKSEEIAQVSEVTEDDYPLYSEAKKEKKFEPFSFDITVPEASGLGSLTQKIQSVNENLTDYAVSGFGEIKEGKVFLATSKGVRKTYSSPYAFLALTAKTKDFSKSFWHGANARSI